MTLRNYCAENMNNTSAGTPSKVKVGAAQPSEAGFKRKRGVFQKDRKCFFLLFAVNGLLEDF